MVVFWKKGKNISKKKRVDFFWGCFWCMLMPKVVVVAEKPLEMKNVIVFDQKQMKKQSCCCWCKTTEMKNVGNPFQKTQQIKPLNHGKNSRCPIWLHQVIFYMDIYTTDGYFFDFGTATRQQSDKNGGRPSGFEGPNQGAKTPQLEWLSLGDWRAFAAGPFHALLVSFPGRAIIFEPTTKARKTIKNQVVCWKK